MQLTRTYSGYLCCLQRSLKCILSLFNHHQGFIMTVGWRDKNSSIFELSIWTLNDVDNRNRNWWHGHYASIGQWRINVVTIAFTTMARLSSAGLCECAGRSQCDVHLGPGLPAGLEHHGDRELRHRSPRTTATQIHGCSRLWRNERGKKNHGFSNEDSGFKFLWFSKKLFRFSFYLYSRNNCIYKMGVTYFNLSHKLK